MDNHALLPKIPGLYQSYMEVKDKYPIGTDLAVVDNTMFIKSVGKQECPKLCDPDVASVMLANGRDVFNKRTWMVLDKEVLTFLAFYKTELNGNSAQTNYNVRKLKILFFLVDETIQVNEQAQKNSGTIQGCLIKRQKIPLPGGDREDGPFYKITDLVVGEKVNFYGKELQINGVDNYTRDFLNKMGIHVIENKPIPDDPYFAYRKQAALDFSPESKSISIRNQPPNGLDGLILKFRGYWDNRYDIEGELRFFDILYYLVDDTMELLEELIDDYGVTHKLFVKRQKLPKRGPWCIPVGRNTKQEILNVISNESNSFYYKMDSRLMNDQQVPYYHCTDLYIGATLNVYNRPIVLVKCDEFTKKFYSEVYGLNNFDPIAAPKTLREIEEELLNQQRVEIILKSQDEVLRKRLIKFSGPGIIFGFIIKMITNDPINKNRNFMLKYYLDDTEFAIYEYRETNSGMRGGMFRSKRGFSEHQEKQDLFTFRQLSVGVKILVDDFKFIITDIDDKTLKFMTSNPKEFPHSNLQTMKSKMRESINKRFESLDEFRTKSFQDRELVEREEFINVVSFEGEIDPHTAIAFAILHKRPDPFEPFSEDAFRSVVQDILRKAQFIHFDGLRSNFRFRKSFPGQEVPGGYVEREESLKAMKSNKVPLSKEITDILLNKFSDTEDGPVKYEDLVKFIDYIADPVEAPSGLARELLFVKPPKALIKVNEFVGALQTEA